MHESILPKGPPTRALRATRLLDCEVRDSSDERIGAIVDVVIDKNRARADYAVALLDPEIVVGSKFFTIGFPAVRCSEYDTVIKVEVPRHMVERAPDPSSDIWPDLDHACAATACETLGATVVDNSGRRLGFIDDLVLDAVSGRIIYVVISIGGFFGLGDSLFVVPYSFLWRRNGGNDRFALAVEKRRLGEMNGCSFDRVHWPNMTDGRWFLSLHEFWRGIVQGAPRSAIS